MAGIYQFKVYLEANGFWAWSASADDRVIMISGGHKSRATAQHHLKEHKQYL